MTCTLTPGLRQIRTKPPWGVGTNRRPTTVTFRPITPRTAAKDDRRRVNTGKSVRE